MKMRIKVLLLAMIPLIVLGVATLIVSNIRISEAMTDSIENGLRGAAISVRDTLLYADDGDYQLDDNDVLWKGNFNVTEHSDIADGIKKATDMDVTLFYGDTRYMTSVCDENGNRVLRTKAGEKVINTVLKGGGEYFATNVDVVGQKYYGYYIPLLDTDSNEVIGMVFSGMPQADAKAKINRILGIIAGIMVAVTIACTIVLWLVVGQIVSSLEKCGNVLNMVAEGRLNTKIDARMLRSKDEVGFIARSISKLQNDLSDIVNSIKDQSVVLAMTSDQLQSKTDVTAERVSQVEQAVDEIAVGAENQAEETQQATDNIILMGNMIEQTNDEIESLNDNAKTIKTTGEAAADALQELENINSQTKKFIDVIYSQTNMTNESAQKIKRQQHLSPELQKKQICCH